MVNEQGAKVEDDEIKEVIPSYEIHCISRQVASIFLEYLLVSLPCCQAALIAWVLVA